MNQTTGLKILALVIAIIMWAYVKVTVGGVTRNSVTQLNLSVPLEVRGAGTSLIPYERSADTIKLTLRGDSEIVDGLREGLVRAWIDVESLSAGGAWPEVQVLVPAHVEILHKEPSSVNVLLSPEMVKEVPIEIETAGSPRTGFIVGKLRFQPTKVKLKGPEDLISQVAKVSGLVPVDGLGSTLSVSVRDLKPVNENGTAVMGKDTAIRLLDAKEVIVTIPIEQQLTLETFSVLSDNVKVNEKPGFKYKIQLDPQFIQMNTSLDKDALPEGVQVKSVTISPVNGQVKQVEVGLVEVEGLQPAARSTVKVTVIPIKKKKKETERSNSGNS